MAKMDSMGPAGSTNVNFEDMSLTVAKIEEGLAMLRGLQATIAGGHIPDVLASWASGAATMFGQVAGGWTDAFGKLNNGFEGMKSLLAQTNTTYQNSEQAALDLATPIRNQINQFVAGINQIMPG